jgi:hypothetical protein
MKIFNDYNVTYTFTGFKADPAKAVSMAVGDDGDLWLKPKDGQWRKVVTE